MTAEVSQHTFTGATEAVRPEGLALFERFAKWLGVQTYMYKILVGGNHDLVLQRMGRERVQEVLNGYNTHGEVVYLQHETVCAGGINIFGSPFAHWGGKNDAFFSDRVDYSDVPAWTDIVVTHMPAILPGERGRNDEDHQLTDALHRVGAQLHVSGHCHWAHGIYYSCRGTASIPCVVASVCDSEWLPARALTSVDGARGDPMDKKKGGYNVVQPGIVVDIQLPQGRPAVLDELQRVGTSSTEELQRSLSEPHLDDESVSGKPAILFFGPPNDPMLVKGLLPKLRETYDVEWVDCAASGIQAVHSRPYGALVSKLGTQGNLGVDIISALRKTQGSAPMVIVHSTTACADTEMCNALRAKPYECTAILGPGDEDELLELLAGVL